MAQATRGYHAELDALEIWVHVARHDTAAAMSLLFALSSTRDWKPRITRIDADSEALATNAALTHLVNAFLAVFVSQISESA